MKLVAAVVVGAGLGIALVAIALRRPPISPSAPLPNIDWEGW